MAMRYIFENIKNRKLYYKKSMWFNLTITKNFVSCIFSNHLDKHLLSIFVIHKGIWIQILQIDNATFDVSHRNQHSSYTHTHIWRKCFFSELTNYLFLYTRTSISIIKLFTIFKKRSLNAKTVLNPISYIFTYTHYSIWPWNNKFWRILALRFI